MKNRRRFTWILLSQNAQVTGFDGTTLQIGFVNAGARDNFASSGSEDVLSRRWPSSSACSGRSRRSSTRRAARRPGPGGRPAAARPVRPGGTGYGGRRPAAPRPAAARRPRPRPAAPPPRQPGAAPAPAPPRAPHRRPGAAAPVAPEDDIPEDDDPDLDESALSGHDLIVRELGATVVEEFTNE